MIAPLARGRGILSFSRIASRKLLRRVSSACAARLFQKREYLIARHARIVVQKVLDRVAALEKVDERVDRNPRTDENRRAAEDLRVGELSKKNARALLSR